MVLGCHSADPQACALWLSAPSEHNSPLSFAALLRCSPPAAQLQSLTCPFHAHSQASPAAVAGYLEPWGWFVFFFLKNHSRMMPVAISAADDV